MIVLYCLEPGREDDRLEEFRASFAEKVELLGLMF